MHAKKLNFTSAVLRDGRWQLTADPIERAEIFGQLQGVVSAKSLVADAPSIEAAIAMLEMLELRYAAQYDGRLDDLEPPPDNRAIAAEVDLLRPPGPATRLQGRAPSTQTLRHRSVQPCALSRVQR